MEKIANLLQILTAVASSMDEEGLTGAACQLDEISFKVAKVGSQIEKFNTTKSELSNTAQDIKLLKAIIKNSEADIEMLAKLKKATQKHEQLEQALQTISRSLG